MANLLRKSRHPVSVRGWRRFDGWVNELYGLGGTTSAHYNTQFLAPDSDPSEFRRLYDGDWLARDIVNFLPADALRKEPQIGGLGGDTDSAKLWRDFKAIDTARWPEGALLRSLAMGRLLGNHALLLGVSGGAQLMQPLQIKAGQTLAWIEEAAIDWLDPLVFDQDPKSPQYGLPSIYRVSQGPRVGLVLHASKVILTAGEARATDIALVDTLAGHIFRGWQAWESVLVPVRKTLADFGISWEAASHLIREASIGVLSMAGLLEGISRDDTTEIEARLRVLSRTKSAAKTLFLDPSGGESFTRTDVKFSGLAELMSLLERQICGAANYPAARLFGRSTSGLNATGEYDMRQYHDRVGLYREQEVSPKLDKILSILAGREVTTVWPSLWESTPLEKEQARKAQADADKVYIDSGVVSAERVALSRAQDGTLGIELAPLEALQQAVEEAERMAAQLRDEPPQALPDEENADELAQGSQAE
jgi:phage-related protein (TIGR01555 family)